MALRIEKLRKSFGTRRAVDELSLTVERGEAVALLGPNGAGKSTTFAMLAGLLVPDGGRVYLGDEELRPSEPAARRRIGVVFQEPSLDGKLSIDENLRFAAALFGLTGRRAATRIDEVLALVGLADRRRELAEALSGGLKRRLEIGRVLLSQPELLLLDEPSSGVDLQTRDRLWDALLALRSSSKLTIVFTTHQIDEAERCDRVAVMDAGRLVAYDTPAALRARITVDLIELETTRPVEVKALVENDFELPVRRDDKMLYVEAPNGPALIPQLVERIGSDRLRAVTLRRPSLGDVFVRLTGRALEAEAA